MALGFRPMCITKDGVKYLIEDYVVLQHDYSVYKTYSCQSSVVFNTAAARGSYRPTRNLTAKKNQFLQSVNEVQR